MTNRANFIIHLAAAFIFAVLASAYAAGGVYAAIALHEPVPILAGVCGVFANGWLFFRMVLHCIAAVGKEVAERQRAAQHRANLQHELDNAFERAMASGVRRPYVPQPRNIIHKKSA